jgi:transcriptional regulator with XRE-family HTH domain
MESIKSMMKARKIGVSGLAEKSGVPIGTLKKIIYGDTKNPSVDTLRAIARALGCTLDDLGGVDAQRSDMPEEHRRLLDAAKDLTVEDVEIFIAFMERIKPAK